MFVPLLFSEVTYEDIMETVRISEATIMTYKKLSRLCDIGEIGIDDESDLLGFAPGAIVEIDAFYFGKNKIAAGTTELNKIVIEFVWYFASVLDALLFGLMEKQRRLLKRI